MTRLVWNQIGDRKFEMGVDRGVLYIDGVGIPWNGLVSVDESPSGGEARPYYMDGVKYLNRPMKEEFEATINAFVSPYEFDQCDGTAQFVTGVYVTQQRRKPFALTYRTRIGNDLDGVDHGYKIHIIYNALASPTQRSYGTATETVDPTLLSWGITTKPIAFSGMRPSSHIIINTTTAPPAAVELMEDILYGDADHAPRLLTPEEIASLFVDPFDFTVTENLDGTYTISGPANSVEMLDANKYKITRDTVVTIMGETDVATISSD